VTAHISNPRTLIRIVNGTYIPVRFSFPFDVEIIATDGRPLRDTSLAGFGKPRGVTMTPADSLVIGAAERYELLLKPEAAHKGLKKARVEFGEWIPKTNTWPAPERRVVQAEIDVVD
jgi:hypothetical protein